MPIILIISALMILANSWHVLSQWVTNPRGYLFAGIAHYYQDYFLYTSFIAQGIAGSWISAHHMFTDEPLGTFRYYWIYVLLGKLGGLVGANAFFVYNASLLVFVILVLYLLWRLAKTLFPQKDTAMIAFLFMGTASNIVDAHASLVGMSWFSPTPALNRLGGVPHQTLQTALLLAIMLLLSNIGRLGPMSRMSLIRLISLIIFSFVAATSNPVQMALLLAAFGSIYFVQYLRDRAQLTPLLSVIICTAVPAAVGAFMANAELSRQSIFAAARVWEQQQHVSATLWEVIRSMGPIALFLPFGVMPYIRKIDVLRLGLALFGIASIAAFLSPIPDLLTVANVRWLHPAPYIFFPVLAAYGFFELVRLGRTIRIPQALSTVALLSFYLLLTIPSWISQIQARTDVTTNTFLTSGLNHIPPDRAEALRLLHNQPEGGSVLADPSLEMDLLIPALSDKPSYTGHMLHTLDIGTKETLRRKFFSGGMTESEKKQFLSNHHIRWIIKKQNTTVEIIEVK